MLHKRLVVLLVLFCSNNRYEAMMGLFNKNCKQDKETIDKLTKDFAKIIDNEALQNLLKNSFVVLHSVKDKQHKEGSLKKIQEVTYDLYNKQLKSSYELDVFTKNQKNILNKNYILEYVVVNKVDIKKKYKNSLLQSSTSSDSSEDNLVVLNNISENSRICFDKKLQVLILQLKNDGIKKQFILIPVVEKGEKISWSFLPINRERPVNSKDELLSEYQTMLSIEPLNGKDSFSISQGNSYKYTETNNFHKIDQSLRKSLENVTQSIVQKNDKDIENILSSYKSHIKQFAKDNEKLLSSIQNKKKNLKEYEEMKKEYINFVLLQSQLLSQTKGFKKHFIDMIEETMKKILKEDCEAFKAELDAKLEPEISFKKEQFQKDDDEHIEVFIKEEVPVQSEKKIESIDSSSSGSFKKLSMPSMSKESSLKNKDFGDVVTSEELIFEVHKGDGTKSEEIVFIPVDVILEEDEVININNNQTVLDTTETHFGTPGISIIVPRNNNETITNLNEFIPVEVTEVLEDDTLVTDSVLYNPVTGNTIEEVRTRKIIEDGDGNKELIETIKTEEKDTRGKIVNEIFVTNDLQTEKQSSVIKIDNKVIIEDEIYRDLTTHKIVEKIVTKEVIKDINGEVTERIEKIEKDQDGHIISDVVDIVAEPENNNINKDVELIVLEPSKKIVVKPKEEPPILYGVEEKWTDKIDNKNDFLLNSKPTMLNEKHVEFNDPQTHTLVKKDIIQETLKDKNGKEHKVEDVTTIERDAGGHITQKLHEINIYASNNKKEHKIPEQTNVQKELNRFEKQNQNNPTMVLQMEEAYTDDKKIVTTQLESISPKGEVYKALLTQYQDKKDPSPIKSQVSNNKKTSVEDKNTRKEVVSSLPKHTEVKTEKKEEGSVKNILSTYQIKPKDSSLLKSQLSNNKNISVEDKNIKKQVVSSLPKHTEVKTEKKEEGSVNNTLSTYQIKPKDQSPIKGQLSNNKNISGEDKNTRKEVVSSLPKHTEVKIEKKQNESTKGDLQSASVGLAANKLPIPQEPKRYVLLGALNDQKNTLSTYQIKQKDQSPIKSQLSNDKKTSEENKNTRKEEHKAEDKKDQSSDKRLNDHKAVFSSMPNINLIKEQHFEFKDKTNNLSVAENVMYKTIKNEKGKEHKVEEVVITEKDVNGRKLKEFNERNIYVPGDKKEHKILEYTNINKELQRFTEENYRDPFVTIQLEETYRDGQKIVTTQLESMSTKGEVHQVNLKEYQDVDKLHYKVLKDKKTSVEDKSIRQNEPKITDKKVVPLEISSLNKNTEVKTERKQNEPIKGDLQSARVGLAASKLPMPQEPKRYGLLGALNDQKNTLSTYQTKKPSIPVVADVLKKDQSPIKSQLSNNKKTSEENKGVRQNKPKLEDKKDVLLKTTLLNKNTEVKTEKKEERRDDLISSKLNESVNSNKQEIKQNNLTGGITPQNVQKHEGAAKQQEVNVLNNNQNLSNKIAENKRAKIEPKEPKDGLNKNSLPPEYKSLSEQHLLDQVVGNIINPVKVKKENYRITNPINGHVTNEYHTFTTLANTPKHQHIIEEDASVENDKNGNITGESYSKIENKFTQKQGMGARQSSVTKKSIRTNRFISETPSRSNSKLKTTSSTDIITSSILKKKEITDEKDKNTQPIITLHSIEKSRNEIEKIKNDNIPFLFAEDEQEANKKLTEQKGVKVKLDKEKEAKLDKEKEVKVKLDKEEKLDQEEKKKAELTQQKTNNKVNSNTKTNKKKDHTMTVLGTGGVLAAGVGSAFWNNTTSNKDNLETTDESENEEIMS